MTAYARGEHSALEIARWIQQFIAQQVQREPERIRLDMKLSRLGIDSVAAVELAAALSEWLEFTLPSTIVYDFENINALSEHCASLVDARFRQRPDPSAQLSDASEG